MAEEARRGLAVVLATHNGAGTLETVLEGYARVRDPGVPWRLIAVDNASSDRTPELLRATRCRLPLEIVEEAALGKNRALNTALARLDGSADFVVFTDDDAVPDADFLTAWCEARGARPEADLFAGTIVPRFQEPPPRWLMGFSGHFGELYAQNTAPQDGATAADRIFGPNMGFRGSIFDEGFRFDERIGPKSGVALYPMGAETEFCVRVAREARAAAWFATAACVHHLVRPWQMTPEFVHARAYRHGRGVAARTYASGTAPHLSARSAAKHALLGMGARLGSPSLRWQYHWNRGFRDWLVQHASA